MQRERGDGSRNRKNTKIQTRTRRLSPMREGGRTISKKKPLKERAGVGRKKESTVRPAKNPQKSSIQKGKVTEKKPRKASHVRGGGGGDCEKSVIPKKKRVSAGKVH